MKRAVLVTVGLLAVAFFYQRALETGLFYTVWWLDLALHFITSLLIGLAFLSVLSFTRKFRQGRLGAQVVLMIVFIGLVALVWESIEFGSDLTFVRDTFYWRDTITDTMMNLAGAFGAIVVHNSRS